MIGKVVALLAASGVHPKLARDLMRHSDINLTMSRYTHTLRGQQVQAIESLPDFSRPDKDAQRATGTDDFTGDNQDNHCAKPCAPERNLANVDGAKEKGNQDTEGDEKYKKTAFSDQNQRFEPEKTVSTERAGFEPAVQLIAVRRFSKPLP